MLALCATRLWMVVRAEPGKPIYPGGTLSGESSFVRGARKTAPLAAAEKLQHTVEWREPFPVTLGHRDAVAEIRAAATDLGLPVRELAQPLRWSEDFGWITHGRRGALFGIGAGDDHSPLHAPDYDFPDALIDPAVALLRRVVDRVLKADAPV